MGRFWRKVVSALGLLLALSPVFVVLVGTGLPEAGREWGLWPLLAVVLAVLVGLIEGRLRAVVGVVGLGAFLAAMAVWGPGGGWLLLAGPSAVLFWLVLLAASRPPFGEWGAGVWTAGAVLHVVGFLAARALALDAIVPVLRVLAFLYVPVFLLAINRLTLEMSASARDGNRPPQRIRSGNRWMVIGISAAVLVLANLRTLRDAFYAAGNWLLGRIGVFLAWLSSLFMSDTPATGAEQMGDMEMMIGEAAGETSLFWRILEKIGIVLCIGIVAVLVVLAAIKLYRVARRLLARLAAHMRGMMAQLSEGVQEKTESILDWDEVREAARRRVQRVRRMLARPPKWQDMDNRQRVRWAYGQTLRPDMPESRTAREALKARTDGARMADIYDVARYSDQAVGDADAEFMRDAVKREG